MNSWQNGQMLHAQDTRTPVDKAAVWVLRAGLKRYVLYRPALPVQYSMSYIYDSLGRKINLDDIAIVDGFFRLKKKSGSNPWPVIEKVIDFWKSKKPTEWKSFLVDVTETKETRRDKKYGLSKGGTMRYTLDIPQYVQYLIRILYNARELPMNKQFFLEFARRFPKMKVAEKL